MGLSDVIFPWAKICEKKPLELGGISYFQVFATSNNPQNQPKSKKSPAMSSDPVSTFWAPAGRTCLAVSSLDLGTSATGSSGLRSTPKTGVRGP
jgi:hypothetical protein